MKRVNLFIAVLFLFSLIVGEIIVRVTHAVSDVPIRIIDAHGIQKFSPNQEGYWIGGEHKWTVNNYGWPGNLPNSFDNLVMVIGDSFIENFMNPNECHQSVFLKKNMPNYNFMEIGRSGVTLIEAMEISNQIDSLKTLSKLIYLTDSDFFESISDINEIADITQLSLKNNTVIPGKITSPGMKKVLYNWKLLHYCYNKLSFKINSNKNPLEEYQEDKSELKSKKEIFNLIEYIASNYTIADKILVFNPSSSQIIKEKCKDAGFKIIELDSSKDEDWTFKYDHHWSCYGHEKAALQVSRELRKML
jgi:hypothetical protein